VYASVHADRTARVLVSQDHSAAGMAGTDAVGIAEAIPLPEGSRLITLPREATAIGRDGRSHPLGRDRLALGAILPRGHVRLFFPAYRDDRSAPPLDPLPYAAVAAGRDGEPLVAAAKVGGTQPHASGTSAGDSALRSHPSNALARQLARCARDNSCAAAGASFGRGDLPVPIGAPPAERPRLPVALRSGYDGSPVDAPAFRPTPREIVDLAVDHLEAGGRSISFGRACDGEPLSRARVVEEAASGIRGRVADAVIRIETAGTDATALRRVIDAGVTGVTIRSGSARADTYERLHGPVSHRWAEVRACLQAAAESGADLTVALLVLPGLSDRRAEIDATLTLLGELPGGTLELRDLGCDPVRTLAAFPRQSGAGMRELLVRLAEADHFRVP
jgi:hypothetical protein